MSYCAQEKATRLMGDAVRKESAAVFGELAVAYLFLGGAGAGALCVCALLDLVFVRQPFGVAAYRQGPSLRPVARMVDFGFLLGLCALVLGVACLLLDLGRPGRAFALFLYPHPTFLTIGSYALAVLVVLAALTVGVRFLYLPSLGARVVRGVEVLVVAVAALVMLYAGMLLQGMGAVALWASPFVPALFVASSLSCGLATVLLVGSFSRAGDRAAAYAMRCLALIDGCVVIVEIVLAAALLASAGGSDHPGMQESLRALIQGSAAPLWWLGFGVCGLLIPLTADICAALGSRHVRALLAVAAVLVLVGAFCLRASVVEAGVHRALALEPVAAADGEGFALPSENVLKEGSFR